MKWPAHLISFVSLATFAFLSFLVAESPSFADSKVEAIDFAKDIQPIFARHCYECHGPQKQKGDLRLDERSSVLRTGAHAVITPGKPEKSELYRRVTLPKGDEEIMPNRGEPLSKQETELIRGWIASGAVWPDNVVAAKHWSYVVPVRAKPPVTKNQAWARNDIDRFILDRLEKEKLQPSPAADRSRLLRRVYLDLIGLPPSPRDVETFLADRSPDAYEKVVDRLLASPQYGERWARPWLDLARYADSSGYQRDNLWDLWPYRDWVINALNADMPFDQFTVEQLAGDLLPNATIAQKVATGFNRCTPINVEAGSDQEESRVNQVFDRVNTLGTVWLGTTIECCQCHNHKYDPFTQKEYYQLFAFFNNTPKESEYSNPHTTIGLEFAGPYLKLPDAKVEEERRGIQEKIDKLDREMEAAGKNLLVKEPEWERKISSELGSLMQSHPLDVAKIETDSGVSHEILDDKSVLFRDDTNDAVPERDTYRITVRTTLTNITGFKLETLSDPSLPGNGPGRGDSRRPNFVLTEFKVAALMPDKKPQSIQLRKARASFEQRNFAVASVLDGGGKKGWGITPQFGRDHWATFETASPIGTGEAMTLEFTLAQNYGGGRMIGRVRLLALTGSATSDDVPAEVVEILRVPSDRRTEPQQKQVNEFYLSRQPQMAPLKVARNKLNRELRNIDVPRTLAMQEMDQPRMSSVFMRGNFLDKGAPVQPDVPAVLPPLPIGAPPNRLMLAKWIASTNNPLTARVTVNRWWAEFFGHGLVGTPEDFGVKGDLPTHPQLLDWLAVEFMESGWSMKRMHRLIVTSATYQQSSAVTEQLREVDDQNKLYGRGPRFRLDAEMIRDNALSIAGLLSAKMGGPPVHPYQPPGIWESKVGGNAVSYDVSEGEDRYRRGLYTVWKRTSPYPSFITFDAPTRNNCVVRRPRSNTPLQALTLLNDPVFVEAAGALVKRVLTEKATASVDEKVRHAFMLCTSRAPDQQEMKTLIQLYRNQLDASNARPEEMKKLLGDFQKPASIAAPEFAAWFSVASALLNLDETITKG